jgi:hypothetical protein
MRKILAFVGLAVVVSLVSTSILKGHGKKTPARKSAQSVERNVNPGGAGGDDPSCPPATCRDVVVDSLPLGAGNITVDHYVSEAGSEAWTLCTSQGGGSWFDCGDHPGWARFKPGDDIETIGSRERVTAHFRNWASRKRDAKIIVSWDE